jgi:hypothetical protein
MPNSSESATFRVRAHWSAPLWLLLMWGVVAAIARALGLARRPAAAASAAPVAGHVASDVVHQLGHAVAAQLTGYPMSGMRFWGVYLSTSYPSDEPPLPPRTHITRAIGGPIASWLFSLFLAGAATAARPGLARRLLWILSAENFVAFTLQAFVPLGFNDGSTLREWMGKRD